MRAPVHTLTRPSVGSGHSLRVLSFASLLFGLLIHLLAQSRSAPISSSATDPDSVVHLCRLVSLRRPYCAAPYPPCLPFILVVSSARPDPHPLVRVDNPILQSLPDCDSELTCDTSVPCDYGPEDPSDILWLRAYDESSKFVVLFNIGLATLVFFIAAIVADGSIFHPHRPGLADASASTLIMLALAVLLYILVVPPELQFALHGDSMFSTLSFILVVFLIAVLLPAFAVIWLSMTVFIIFFIGFLIEHVFIIVLATLHYVLVLVVYQITFTAWHVRLVYFPPEDDEVSTHNRQVLSFASTSLERIRSNWFMQRLPNVLEDRAIRVIQNHLPDSVTDQLVRDHIPQISSENLDVSSPSSNPPENPPSPPSPPPSRSIPSSWPTTISENSDERPASPAESTPLLRSRTVP